MRQGGLDPELNCESYGDEDSNGGAVVIAKAELLQSDVNVFDSNDERNPERQNQIIDKLDDDIV